MAVSSVQTTSQINVDECRRNLLRGMQRRAEERDELRRRALLDVCEKAPAILGRHPSVVRAYVFGSVTKPGSFHAGLDIDIAVEGTTAEAYFAVWRDLERVLTDWIVDVREINDDSLFATRIRASGMLIYER